MLYTIYTCILRYICEHLVNIELTHKFVWYWLFRENFVICKGPFIALDQYWFFFDIPNHMLLCHAAQYIFSLKALLLSHFQIIQEKSQFPQSKAFIDRSFPATLEFKKLLPAAFSIFV